VTAEELAELRAQIERAAVRLEEKATVLPISYSEKLRLEAKADGVRLALAHFPNPQS
jgi:hypothetical protein